MSTELKHLLRAAVENAHRSIDRNVGGSRHGAFEACELHGSWKGRDVVTSRFGSLAPWPTLITFEARVPALSASRRTRFSNERQTLNIILDWASVQE